MFLIKDIKINNGLLYITDKKNTCYSIQINANEIKNLLPLASNKSSKIKKNIRYFEKYFIICIICMIICGIGAFGPLLVGDIYAEVFLLGFGLLELASTALAVSSKIYIKWLKKYAISNEYWEEILKKIKDKENKKIDEKVNNNYYKTYNYKKDNTVQVSSNKTSDNSTYSYSKNQIIQDYYVKDKIKTYKRY